MAELKDEPYYHCGYCTEDVAIELPCPCCGLGEVSHPEMLTILPDVIRLRHDDKGLQLLDDLLQFILKSKAERETLFKAMREKYDWGYIDACKAIQGKLMGLIEEYKDECDRAGRD